MSSLSQPLARRAGASPQLVMLIVCAGVVLASLDLFIVNVALPSMARDFDLRGDAVADLSWVLNAYAIVYAALLVLFGRGAERFPRERGFLLGLAVFVAGSAACAAATSVGMLVAFRVVPAAGAGRDGGAADHRRGRRAGARAREGLELGLGRSADARCVGWRGRRARALRGARPSRPQPARRPRAVPAAAVHRRLDGGGVLLGRVRRDAALARAVDAGRLALVGAEHRPGDRARSADGPAVLVRGRGSADRALRP